MYYARILEKALAIFFFVFHSKSVGLWLETFSSGLKFACRGLNMWRGENDQSEFRRWGWWPTQ